MEVPLTHPELGGACDWGRLGETSWAHLFKMSPDRPPLDLRVRGGDADDSTVGVDLH